MSAVVGCDLSTRFYVTRNDLRGIIYACLTERTSEIKRNEKPAHKSKLEPTQWTNKYLGLEYLTRDDSNSTPLLLLLFHAHLATFGDVECFMAKPQHFALLLNFVWRSRKRMSEYAATFSRASILLTALLLFIKICFICCHTRGAALGAAAVTRVGGDHTYTYINKYIQRRQRRRLPTITQNANKYDNRNNFCYIHSREGKQSNRKRRLAGEGEKDPIGGQRDKRMADMKMY